VSTFVCRVLLPLALASVALAGAIQRAPGLVKTAAGPRTDPTDSVYADRFVVRVPLADLAHLPAHPHDCFDGESVDGAGPQALAVLFLSAAEAAALAQYVSQIENLGTVSDYLAAFAPVRTLRAVPQRLRCYDPLRQRLMLPDCANPVTDPCIQPIVSLEPYDRYHSLDEGVCFLQNLAQQFPQICRLVSIGTSVEGRDIWALVVSDNGGAREPGEEQILFTGVTHAREWISFEMVLYLAECLACNYPHDPHVRQIVDRAVVWMVPAVNPDGYEYSWTVDRLWRKNRRYNGNGSWGVDINRNYDFRWGYDNWGSSPNPDAQIYRGPYPASEPETQAIQNLLAAEVFAIAVSFHSYGQYFLHPWGFTAEVLPRSDAAFRAAAGKSVRLIYGSSGAIYRPGQSSFTLYSTNGDFNDYAYGAAGVLAFTVELRPVSSLDGGFLLPEDQILPCVQENTAAAIWLMLNVANATDYGRGAGQPLLELPGPGLHWFSLPLTPARQKPQNSINFPMIWADNFRVWLDDAYHQPPGWHSLGDEVEGLGAASGCTIDVSNPELAHWATSLNSYRVLPYIFEDAVELVLSNVEPGLNLVGVPARQALPMQEIRIQRQILSSANYLPNFGRRVLAERTALQDFNSPAPWLDWTWSYTDPLGQVYLAHPTGAGGADPLLYPFRVYAFSSRVPSWRFGSYRPDQPFYVLRLPGFIAFDFSDCNYNATPDSQDIAAGASPDCNGNGVPDECELRGRIAYDCNGNGIIDECDIATGHSADCSSNGTPDECEPDCNANGVADSCDIAWGTSEDCAGEGVPDECEPDCNSNGIADSCDILAGASLDCDGQGVPDECQPALFIPLRIAVSGNASGEFLYYLEQAGHVLRELPRSEPLGDYLWRYDVLLLAPGSLGDRPQDEQRIDQFVAAGKGLIIFAGATDNYRGQAYPLAGRFGWVRRTGTVLVDPEDPVAYQLGPASALDGFSTSPVLKADARTVLTWQDGVPMTIVRSYGLGRVVYFNDLWGCYQQHWRGDPPYGMRLMRNALAWVAPPLPDDCNANGRHDACDIFLGNSLDANANGIPDECEIPGDLNCDRAVDLFDIDSFVLALVDPDRYALVYPNCFLRYADINGDGTVDAFDIDPFVELLTGR